MSLFSTHDLTKLGPGCIWAIVTLLDDHGRLPLGCWGASSWCWRWGWTRRKVTSTLEKQDDNEKSNQTINDQVVHFIILQDINGGLYNRGSRSRAVRRVSFQASELC
jgi:hypothetical protein